MTVILRMLGLTLIIVFGTGCTTGYWIDRGHDAMDMFTATVAGGSGAKVRVGPIHAGFLGASCLEGIKNGSVISTWQKGPDDIDGGDDATSFLPIKVSDTTGILFSYEEYPLRGNPVRPDLQNQRNTFNDVAHAKVPFISYPIASDKVPNRRARYKYYTQIDIACGLLVGGRIGFNPGELVDFLLGFIGIDIYDDDFERWKKENIEHSGSGDEG